MMFVGSIRKVASVLALLLATVVAHADGFAAGSMLEGKVVGVADGDTLTVLLAGNRNIKVRLAEIDAPEKSQAFGQVSRKSLSDLVYGKLIKVRVNDTDKYGRTVGRVFVGKLDVNLMQVERGLAWAYDRYVTDSKIPAAQKVAQSKKIGLWADREPTPPWLFRRGASTSSASTAAPALERSVEDLHSVIEAMLGASKAMRAES